MKKRSRIGVHLAWLLVAVVAAGAGWWAASNITQPVLSQETNRAQVTVTVEQGEIGQQVNAQGTVSFDTARSLFSGTDGVVTGASLDPGAELSSGDVLLTVDLRPIVLAQGAVPAFRDLSQKMSGPDVAQLRKFLKLPEGQVFDYTTRTAVIAWQKTHGLKADGILHLGDILFVPDLPTRAFLADEIEVGATISLGQRLLNVAQSSPKIAVDGDSLGQITAGMTVTVTTPAGNTIAGELEGPYRGDDGLERFVVRNRSAGDLCDQECAQEFPIRANSRVTAQVDVMPTVTGLVVPHSALAAMADGSVALRLESGELQPIDIIQQGQGTSIITGVDQGTVIQLFADQGDSAPGKTVPTDKTGDLTEETQ